MTVPQPEEAERGWIGPVASAFAAAAVFALVVVAGVANPVPVARPSTDRLGPAAGTGVAQYVADARETVTGNGPEPRWALVSLDRYLSAAETVALTAGVRVSEVYAHVPIDRVQTPILSVAVPDDARALADAVRAAASSRTELPTPGTDPDSERARRVLEVSTSRLAADCACVAALLVHAPVADLARLVSTPTVRAVEALPADARYGRFAVVPLLPEQTDQVGVLPDDGPVPAN